MMLQSYTPLTMAAMHNSSDMLMLLLQYSADPNKPNDEVRGIVAFTT